MKKIDLMLCLAVVGMMASGCTLEGACKDQDLKCLTDPDTQEGVRYTCIDGAWMNKELGNSCKDEKTWGICLNGARKCEDGGMKTCVNGAWSAPDNSCGSRGCKSTSECADCSDDEVLCNKETNRYKPCMNGAWLSMDFSCPSDLCNEDGTGCADKTECAGSDVECYDGVLKTCHEGKWHEEKCPNDTACKLDNTGCAECSGNETSCKDGSYRVCFNEVWQDVKSCTCKDDKVCAECTAGQSECDSLSSYRECSSSNVWGKSQSCGNRNCAVNDTKAECTDAPVTCDDNKKQCIGNTLYVCNSNDWNEVKTCEFGCNSEKLDCYECEEGKMSCTNGQLKKCINHVWSEPIVCKGGACLDENICANCVLGISCSDNSDSVGTVTKCEDGITQTQLKCENVSCNAERNDCGKCVNSAQKCVTGDDMIGTPYICVNGGWSYGNRCSGEASCKNDTQCGDCRNGTTKCEDGKVFTCKDASWGTGVPCANGCNSSGSGCLPSDVCVNGSERCENGVKYTCLNNAWGSEKTCTGGVSCADDTRCGECVNSRSTCENGVLYICQNGIWGVGIACQDNADCKDNGVSCGDCKNGSKKCEDGKAYTCSGGVWSVDAMCSENASCKDDKECGVCKNSSVKCSNDESGNGVRFTCINGAWNDSPCGGVSCKDDVTCGICKNGSKKCEENKLFICESGAWKESTQCLNGCASNEQACAPSDVCINGNTKCEAGAMYHCDNNNWVETAVCEDEASCMSNTKCGECKDGTTKCENNGEYSCSGGKWGMPNTCPNGCYLSLECADCNTGTKKCENNVAYVCKPLGVWDTGTICPNGCDGQVCKIKDCTNGQITCTNNGDLGQYKRCTNEKWPSSVTACPNDSSCKSSSECGVCKNNTTRCYNTMQQRCNNGSWSNEMDCPNGCNSFSGTCMYCKDSITVTSGTVDDIYCVKDVLFNKYCTAFDYPKLLFINGDMKSDDVLQKLERIVLPLIFEIKGELSLRAPNLSMLEMSSVAFMGSFWLDGSLISSLQFPMLDEIESKLVLMNNSKLTSVSIPISRFSNGKGIIDIENNGTLKYMDWDFLEEGVSEITLKGNAIEKINLPYLGKVNNLSVINDKELYMLSADAMQTIDNLNITNNSKLEEISFPSISEIGVLEVIGNKQLSCDLICKIAEKAKEKKIHDNSEGYCPCS